MKKDFSLLHPFDLEAAKRGEEICWYETGDKLEYIGTSTSPVAGCFRWLEGVNKDTFETYPAGYIRMKPLCWVEGRPVYKGDVLWHRRRGQIVASHMIDDGEFLCEEGVDSGDRVENLTWTPPKVKREVKLLAYLDDDQLFWLRETSLKCPFGPAVRVPSEDKTIEVAE